MIIVKYKDKPRKPCNLEFLWRPAFKLEEGYNSEQIIERIKEQIRLNKFENGKEWAWQIVGGGHQRMSIFTRLGVIDTWL